MNFVNANGQPINVEAMKLQAIPRRQSKKEAPAEFHKGWRVQGHAPGAMEQARAESQRLTNLWNSQTELEKAEALRSGDRQPPEWDELKWRRDTRKKPVRSKPYEIPEAAKLCADMATKAGWLDIEVAELKKSKAGA